MSGTTRVLAGAFLQGKGSTQIIATAVFERSGDWFGPDGRIKPLPQYRKFELQTYAEYGATDWLTLILAPSYSRASGFAGPTRTSDGVLRVETGARTRLWQNETSIVSLQATARLADAVDRAAPPGLRREVNEIDLRALYGRNFEFWSRHGFVNLETAYRFRAGACDEFRADITLGYKLYPRFMVLAQMFSVWTKRANPLPFMRSHKLQMSGVFEITPAWSVQAGAYSVFAGINVRRDLGLVAGVWRRF